MLEAIVPPFLVIAAASLLWWCRSWYVGRRGGLAWRADVAGAVALVAVAAVLELASGRPAAYEHGPVRLWAGSITSDENSQQVADPYTLTHVVHGVLFYGLTRAVMGPAYLIPRAAVAVTIESAWEALENTDAVINRYRAETITLGYHGDSVINSIGDIVACMLGFALASRLRWWWSVLLVIVTEVGLAAAIRDNLTLNVIMLIHPVEAIRRWQLGA